MKPKTSTLTPEQRLELKAATQPATDKRDKIVQAAIAEHQAEIRPLWEKYRLIIAAARAEYSRVRQAEYARITGTNPRTVERKPAAAAEDPKPPARSAAASASRPGPIAMPARVYCPNPSYPARGARVAKLEAAAKHEGESE